MLLPCLNKKGLEVLPRTADQRFELDPKTFLRTHFPMRLYKKIGGRNKMEEWTEEHLVDNILITDGVGTGNRIYILFGATGSGKSELSRWIQSRIETRDPERSKVTIRVSRTELDIVRIADKFHSQVLGGEFSKETLNKWDELKDKPYALTLTILSSALNHLLSNDSDFKLYFDLLSPKICQNLDLYFKLMSDPNQELGQVLEFLSAEQFVDATRRPDIRVSFSFDELRNQLSREFDRAIMGGISIKDTLKKISFEIYNKKGMRPVLLIDDIVQSMNMYAADLMDYFITLEEGNWDVIIGVTPSSLKSTARGKEFLNNISHKDTIDDRVNKLWLSDEAGDKSYFLNEDNCKDFVKPYLEVYKEKGGYVCGNSCPKYEICRSIQADDVSAFLSPFNEHTLRRIFRQLPQGKGKARFVVNYLRDILNDMNEGTDIFTALKHYDVISEIDVNADSKIIKNIAEYYLPTFYNDMELKSEIPTAHLRFFGLSLNKISIEGIRILNIERYKEVKHDDKEVNVQQTGSGSTQDTSQGGIPGKHKGPEVVLNQTNIAIRSWLNEGTAENPQLLRPLRKGIAILIEVFMMPEVICTPSVSKVVKELRWDKVQDGHTPAIILNSLDSGFGIEVSRSIGPLAYELSSLGEIDKKKEPDKWSEQFEKILKWPEASIILISGRRFHDAVVDKIQKSLGIETDKLALYLYTFMCSLNGLQGEKIVPQLLDCIPMFNWSDSPSFPSGTQKYYAVLKPKHIEFIQSMFNNFFRIRENLYDGYRIKKYLENFNPVESLNQIINLNFHTLENYKFKDQKLSFLLQDIRAVLLKVSKIHNEQDYYTLINKFDRISNIINKYQRGDYFEKDCRNLIGIELPKNFSDKQQQFSSINYNFKEFERDKRNYEKIIDFIKTNILPVGKAINELNPFEIFNLLYKLNEVSLNNLFTVCKEFDEICESTFLGLIKSLQDNISILELSGYKNNLNKFEKILTLFSGYFVSLRCEGEIETFIDAFKALAKSLGWDYDNTENAYYFGDGQNCYCLDVLPHFFDINEKILEWSEYLSKGNDSLLIVFARGEITDETASIILGKFSNKILLISYCYNSFKYFDSLINVISNLIIGIMVFLSAKNKINYTKYSFNTREANEILNSNLPSSLVEYHLEIAKLAKFLLDLGKQTDLLRSVGENIPQKDLRLLAWLNSLTEMLSFGSIRIDIKDIERIIKYYKELSDLNSTTVEQDINNLVDYSKAMSSFFKKRIIHFDKCCPRDPLLGYFSSLKRLHAIPGLSSISPYGLAQIKKAIEILNNIDKRSPENFFIRLQGWRNIFDGVENKKSHDTIEDLQKGLGISRDAALLISQLAKGPTELKNIKPDVLNELNNKSPDILSVAKVSF